MDCGAVIPCVRALGMGVAEDEREKVEREELPNDKQGEGEKAGQTHRCGRGRVVRGELVDR